jgi:hypothetical protein
LVKRQKLSHSGDEQSRVDTRPQKAQQNRETWRGKLMALFSRCSLDPDDSDMGALPPPGSDRALKNSQLTSGNRPLFSGLALRPPPDINMDGPGIFVPVPAPLIASQKDTLVWP